MSTHMTLGLIPAWQFSMDPAVNYKINPFVQYPDGVYQTTPQPLGPYYQGPELSGLGANPFWWLVGNRASDQAGRELDQRLMQQMTADRQKRQGTAGPRMMLHGPNLQLLGLAATRVRRQRTMMGIGLGLGAIALLGTLFKR